MSCCPPGSLGAPGPKEYKTVGAVISEGGVDAYVVGESKVRATLDVFLLAVPCGKMNFFGACMWWRCKPEAALCAQRLCPVDAQLSVGNACAYIPDKNAALSA